MDTIIETPGLQHIAEKMLQPLKVKDIKSLFSINQNIKELEGRCNSPKFWFHKISFQSNNEKKKATDVQQFRLNEFVISWKILISNCKNEDILKKMRTSWKFLENSDLEAPHAPIDQSLDTKNTCPNPLSIAAQFGYLDLAKKLIEKIEKLNGFIPRRHLQIFQFYQK